ncbi:MAG: hypothetical protein KDK07_16065 [Bauldia sp.]|nr:hypothetical protein [Bauldia sp.]
MASPRSASMTRVETDLAALAMAGLRALPYVLAVAALSATIVFLLLERMAPLYRADARIAVDIGTTDAGVARSVLDGEMQLIRSRDIALGVVESLELSKSAEYRGALAGDSVMRSILVILGLARDVSDLPPDERVLAHFAENLRVVPTGRADGIIVSFWAADPDLAARGANAVAEAYVALRDGATGETAASLADEIARLRAAVADAEAHVAALREAASRLPTGLDAESRAEVEAELASVRASVAAAESEAAAIRAGIAGGTIPDTASIRADAQASALFDEQRSLREALVQETAANPLGNPRIAEIRARLTEVDAALEENARRIAGALDATAVRGRERMADLQKRLADADAATAAAADIAAAEAAVADVQSRLDEALKREDALRQSGVLPDEVRIAARATVPAAPAWPDTAPIGIAAFVAILLLGLTIAVLRELASGRAFRRLPFEPLAGMNSSVAAAGRLRRVEDEELPRAMPDAPSLAPDAEADSSLGEVADSVAGRRRIIVTLAEDSDADGRPLAAVALARALSGRDRTVVLVDLQGDDADGAAMGESAGLPGFSDLLSGDASFAQAIFRDRRSRAHFIPAGHAAIGAEDLAGERFATLLTALDHTYDHVILDCAETVIPGIAPGADAALVASEHGSTDPRTIRAAGQIAKVSTAHIFHLKVDPPRRPRAPDPAPKAEAA